MDMKPGDVVILKSGGQPLTVAEVHEDDVSCIWIGEEGELFRETLPSIVLELAIVEHLDDEGDDDEDHDDEDEDEDDHKRIKDKVA